MPDICGGIAFPEIVKRYRDGRAVLDFIKASQDEQSNATIAIMCSNSAYGNGLKLALQCLSKNILVFETPEAARKTSIKDKQSQILRSSEHILELLNNEKF